MRTPSPSRGGLSNKFGGGGKACFAVPAQPNGKLSVEALKPHAKPHNKARGP